jgi:Ca2+-binding RTX toxin-like protein
MEDDSMKWLFSPTRRKARPLTPPAKEQPLRLEALDERCMPAALEVVPSAHLINGRVDIFGTDYADRKDNVGVSQVGNNVVVSLVKTDLAGNVLYQSQRSFPLSQITGGIFFDGKAGADTFVNATALGATVLGGDGNDLLLGGYGRDLMFGGNGNDSLQDFGGSNNSLIGGAGNDLLISGAGGDFLSGEGGNDRMFGGAGNDSLFGGAGNDEMDGDTGNDTLDGGTGNDTLRGDNVGLIFSGGGNDTLRGGGGADLLLGNSGADVIDGQGGDDVLDGGRGNDRLHGGGGTDTLFGGDGNDRLDGGYDGLSDRLIGGLGADTFVIHQKGLFGLEELDPIIDFIAADGDDIDKDYHF